MSVREWIESRVPGGIRSPVGTILDVAFASEYGADTADLSALNLADLLDRQQFGMPSARQYHIAGGNEQLPLRIAELLAPGVLALRWRLVALARRSDESVVLTFATPEGTREVNADHVILALPFAVLRTLDYQRAGFDVLKHRAIQEVGRGRNAKLHMQFRRRLWTAPGPWGLANGASVTDLGYQTMYEVSRGQAGATGILVNYRGGAVADRLRPSSPYTTGSTLGLAAEGRWLLANLDRVWPASLMRGTARSHSRLPRSIQTSAARTRIGGLASTIRCAATSASGSATSTSPASIARSSSRAIWKAPPPRVSEPRTRCAVTWECDDRQPDLGMVSKAPVVSIGSNPMSRRPRTGTGSMVLSDHP
jgi:monoamine oxidase